MTKKPSVSKILDTIYPFGESDHWARYLSQKNIQIENCQVILTNIGTSVHQTSQDLLFDIPIKESEIPGIQSYHQQIKGFIDSLSPGDGILESEKYVECDQYCGTFDALIRINGKVTLVDFKTWGAYKFFYNLSGGDKPPDKAKLKKTALQLSLYRAAYEGPHEIKEQAVLWFTPNNYELIYLPYDISAYLKSCI